MKLFGRKQKVDYRGLVVYLKRDYFDVYFPKNQLKKVAYFYFDKQKINPRFIDKLVKFWNRTYVGPFLKIKKKIEGENLKSLSDEELDKELLAFSRVYGGLWAEMIFLDAFDACGDEILLEILNKEKVSPSESQLNILTAPREPSWLQRERMSMLKVAKEVRKDKVLAREVVKVSYAQIKNRKPSLVKMLTRHSEQFHWIYNDYAVIKFLHDKFFFNELRNLLKNPGTIDEESRELRAISRNNTLRHKVFRNLGISKSARNQLVFLVRLSGLRDSRKSYNQMGSAVLHLFAREYSRRRKLPLLDTEYLFWTEIYKNYPAAKVKALAKKRRAGVLYAHTTASDMEKDTFFGSKGKALKSVIDRTFSRERLHGKPAYPGVVKGRARTMLTKADFKRMRKGDVLLAANTRPEYVPIMKMAGAIVTEEGGLTCHAAIVSRELKKPCVVGVQGVLGAVEEGDMVEVDAQRGVVKKLGNQ